GIGSWELGKKRMGGWGDGGWGKEGANAQVLNSQSGSTQQKPTSPTQHTATQKQATALSTQHSVPTQHSALSTQHLEKHSERGLELHTPSDIYETVERIGERIKGLFGRHPEHNAAVLVRTNDQGLFVASELRRLYPNEIEIFDVGDRDRQSHVPREILSLLQFIERPHSPDNLKAALDVLLNRKLIPSQDLNALATAPETFLYPGPLDPPIRDISRSARHLCRAMLRARMELPPYQLITFLALTLKYNQTELATADKLGDRIAIQAAGESSLFRIVEILTEITQTEQFEPVDVESSAEDSPYTRPGQLTIITMHKAKGLDWDYVFLPFLQEQNLPGSLWVTPSAKFLGDYTLAEVARAQIRAFLHEKPLPSVALAWEQAEYLKTAEEFRLLYVAMTRAKRLLWMSAAKRAPFSWNLANLKRRNNLEEKRPCPVIPALKQKFPQAVVF
ncbi:MAG: hypothetical protein LRZ84_26290, partial [Desertifilum sp.]|nr:hypothetical protein [Desertifilum sp.]